MEYQVRILVTPYERNVSLCMVQDKFELVQSIARRPTWQLFKLLKKKIVAVAGLILCDPVETEVTIVDFLSSFLNLSSFTPFCLLLSSLYHVEAKVFSRRPFAEETRDRFQTSLPGICGE